MIDDADRTSPVAEPIQRGRATRRLLAILRSPYVRMAFLLAMVGLLVFTLINQGATFWHDLRTLPLWVVVAALLANIAAYSGSMLAWRAGLRILGSRLSIPQAWRIFFIGQLGKYLPGSVWPVLAQIELSAGEGVPRVRAALSIGVSIGIILSTGVIVSGAALPFVMTGSVLQWAVAGLVVVAGAVAFTPSVATRCVNATLRLARQSKLVRPLVLGDVAEAVGAAMLNWLAGGLMTYVLIGPIGGHDAEIFVTSLAAYAISWVAGYLVVVAPAGAGVREAVMVAVLATHVSTSAALTVALVCRALSVMSDVITAGGAAGAAARKRLLDARARENTAQMNTGT